MKVKLKNTKEKKTNGHSGRSVSELNSALVELDTLMERCVCPYMLLKDTAHGIYKNRLLFGDEIVIGFQKRQFTREMRSTLTSFLPKDAMWTDKTIKFKYGEVPVTMYIIGRNYRFFRHPDTVFYLAGQFKIPNPFDKYWKARFLIQ